MSDDEVICPSCRHQFRAIPFNVQSELATEHKRREAAEALLDAANLFLNDSKSTLARNVETNIKAHFAHYKD